MQEASYLEGGPLMLPMCLQVNPKYDDDDDDDDDNESLDTVEITKELSLAK